MTIPAVGQSWPDGHVLRVGRPLDAVTVSQWTSGDPRVAGALTRAVGRLSVSDQDCYVLEDQAGAVVGVFVVEPPHLQFAFVPAGQRGRRLGPRATAVLLEDYFTRHGQQWIGDGGSTTADGDRLIDRFGFDWDEARQANVLDWPEWHRRRASVAAWF